MRIRFEALRRVFHPQWNLPFDDADFYQCAPTNTIKLEVVLGDIIDAFRDLESYGHWLSGWDAAELRRRTEPGEGLEDALRIRLKVGEDLEPSWRVIKNDDDEGISFRAPDRGKVAVSLIGAFSDRHLTWSRGSLLGHLTDADNLSPSLAEASRAARTALEGRRAESLASFDTVAGTAEVTARSRSASTSPRRIRPISTLRPSAFMLAGSLFMMVKCRCVSSGSGQSACLLLDFRNRRCVPSTSRVHPRWTPKIGH